ncbi:SHOCT domain-containing protein [Geodermatophilus sp. SYSU D01186]
MMGWYGWNHMSGWGWFAMTASTVLLLALLVGGIVLLVRVAQQASQGDARRPHAGSRPSPEDVLAERFARGEISEDEYRQRLAVLADPHPGTPRR